MGFTGQQRMSKHRPMLRIFHLGALAAALSVAAGCATRQPPQQRYELSREEDRSLELFRTRQFHSAAQILSRLVHSHSHRQVKDKLLACSLNDTDYRTALAVLGRQMSQGNDRASQAGAAMAAASICLKELGFGLRAGEMLNHVRVMCQQDPSLVNKLAHRFGFSPADEESFRREQDTYAHWWVRFCRVKDMYYMAQHREALGEVEDMQRAVLHDPLLSLWAGKIKMEQGDLAHAARELAAAVAGFEQTLLKLGIDGQWEQEHVYEDELNEARLMLGRCLLSMGKHTGGHVQLSRVPKWSKFSPRAQALLTRAAAPNATAP